MADALDPVTVLPRMDGIVPTRLPGAPNRRITTIPRRVKLAKVEQFNLLIRGQVDLAGDPLSVFFEIRSLSILRGALVGGRPDDADDYVAGLLAGFHITRCVGDLVQ